MALALTEMPKWMVHIDNPPGSYLLIKEKVTDREGSPPFLYSYHGWPYKLLNKAEVNQFLRRPS
jgi:hypothetical protein